MSERDFMDLLDAAIEEQRIEVIVATYAAGHREIIVIGLS